MSHRTRKRLPIVILAFGLFATGVFTANSSWLYGAPGGAPVLLAHRGLARATAARG